MSITAVATIAFQYLNVYPMTDPNIGRLIANRYQLQELIGTGPISQVYRAKDTLLGGVAVAVKFLSLSINPRLEVPQQLKGWVMECLAKAPSDRFQNISEILQTLALL